MKKRVNGKKRQSGWVFRGITGDAKRLGVTRTHLYLVLSGKRESRSLMQRYRAIERGQAANEARKERAA